MKRPIQSAAIAIALLCCAQYTAAARVLQAVDGRPQAPVPSASIAGTVTDRSGAPVRGARITLTAPELRVQRSVTSDQRGAFVFLALTAGRYVIAARRDGFLTAAYGSRAPGRPGTPVSLAAGQKLERINLSLARGGVITGSILDLDGEPAIGVDVRVLRVTMIDGQRRLQHAGSDRTDDRGAYRIYHLLPGDYVVSATPPRFDSGDNVADNAAAALDAKEPAEAAAYSAVYYPGTVMPGDATRVHLEESEEHNGVGFELQLVPTVTIAGTVTPDVQQRGCNARIALVRNATPIPSMPADVSVAEVEGDRFTFAGVAPGQYRLIARCAQPRAAGKTGQVLWAERELLVSGRDISGADLALRPGRTVSGQIRLDGTEANVRGDLSAARVMLVPHGEEFDELGRQPSTARIEPGGRFTIGGVAPGLYEVDGTLPQDLQDRSGGRSAGRWAIDSVIVNGRDALDFLLEVRADDVTGVELAFSDRRQELSGTIVGASGTPAAEYTIVVFPEDNRFWLPGNRRIKSTRPATDGRFTFDDLPAGGYRIAALTDVEPGEWQNPDFLRQLFGASVAVTVRAGEKTIHDLKVVR